MRSVSISLKSILLVIVSIVICVSILSISKNKLQHYYDYNQSITSEESINEIIYALYPNAYEPYKNLDYLIGDYKYIDHIYKLNFTQKIPVYIYMVTTSNISSISTFLIMFNDYGTIENLVFLDKNNLYTVDDFNTKLKNKNAKHLDLDDIYNNNNKNNHHIINGIKSASLNFIYEVQ